MEHAMNSGTPSQEFLGRLAQRGISQRRIATALSKAPSAITALFNGTRRLSFDEAAKLKRAFPDASSQDFQELPIIGVAGAGNWEEAIAVPEDFIHVPNQLGGAGRFVVTVRGESMNLVLRDGSLAIVDPTDRDVYAGSIYLIQNGDGEGTIKRFRSDPASFEPVSSDPSFQPILIGSMKFHVIGRIVGAMQKF
jgi:SOS-response transcriptional repressor LexA